MVLYWMAIRYDTPDNVLIVRGAADEADTDLHGSWRAI